MQLAKSRLKRQKDSTAWFFNKENHDLELKAILKAERIAKQQLLNEGFAFRKARFN